MFSLCVSINSRVELYNSSTVSWSMGAIWEDRPPSCIFDFLSIFFYLLKEIICCVVLDHQHIFLSNLILKKGFHMTNMTKKRLKSFFTWVTSHKSQVKFSYFHSLHVLILNVADLTLQIIFEREIFLFCSKYPLISSV